MRMMSTCHQQVDISARVTFGYTSFALADSGSKSVWIIVVIIVFIIGMALQQKSKVQKRGLKKWLNNH